MELVLPKWLCEELQKRTDFSLQYMIKQAMIELVNNPYEGYAVLDIIKQKEEMKKRKIELDRGDT